MDQKQIHLIGNAHIDPVWLWRFPEGFAEIKATFKAALDRIREHDTFIFTSACAFYYKWVEENCPPLFEEIREAVKAGRWHIVGGMWIQPDCNIPSAESFARHFLYSQRYFEEKFGIRVDTGYNVDSFGHSAGLPRLLREGGISNYVYMRPSNDAEMQYPFREHTFRWKAGDHEVVASRLRGYGGNMGEEQLKEYDSYVTANGESIMLFYGVGNHGGGPTVQTIRNIDAYIPHAQNDMQYSDPDSYFKHMRETAYETMPVYEGELQNHASGCYSANAAIKALNRTGENRLNEAERLEVLANVIFGTPMHPEKNAEAWQNLLFNQFHDIMCGCADKTAYDDAYAFGSASVAHGLKLTNEAAQRIAWDIDTAKNIPTLSKDKDWIIWDAGETGAPLVVFNPLSHPVSVPVWIHRNTCTAVTDENGAFIPYQRIRATWTNSRDKFCIRFIADVPAYGWKTFWSYNTDAVSYTPDAPYMQVTEHMLANDRISVAFDRETGCIAAITDCDGNALIGEFAAKAFVIDDTENDTWAHGKFIFDQVIGVFGNPVFEICETGPCEVSLRVTQTYRSSMLVQTYTLYPHDERVHASVRLVLNEPLVQIKLAFDSGIRDADFIREVPGGIVCRETGGREEPMQRFMAAVRNNRGIAVINDCKYSASEKNGVFAFIAARSCFFADHYGIRDNRMINEDIGVQEFTYDIMPYHGDLSAVMRAAEERNTVFPVIPETYHYGSLAQSASHFSADSPNVTLSAVKPAEDGNGIIIRLTEIAGQEHDVSAVIFGTSVQTHIKPFDIQSFRIADGCVTRVDFTEKAK